MRRWFIVFMLLAVQFQLVWAAAAQYCGHETKTTAALHFGHHPHQHQVDATKATVADDNAGASATFHADCGSCHLGASASLPSAVIVIAMLPRIGDADDFRVQYTSHIPWGPERPDRLELPAAVRSGGGVEFRLLSTLLSA